MGKVIRIRNLSHSYSNEDLLEVISKMLSDEYFSWILDTVYFDKKDQISRYAKKIASKSLESSDARDLLLKTYRILKDIWLSEEEETKLDSLEKIIERDESLLNLWSLVNKDILPVVGVFEENGLEKAILDAIRSRYLGCGAISKIIEEAEPIAQYLAIQKAIEKVPKSYPTLELYKPKKHFNLELLRGRAPGTLSLVS